MLLQLGIRGIQSLPCLLEHFILPHSWVVLHALHQPIRLDGEVHLRLPLVCHILHYLYVPC